MSSVKICMNGLCGAKTTSQWRRGWPMKAGGFSTLCYSCGTAYDHLKYCERFHLNEPGWRECKFCEKPIHCGCVASKYLYECLDLGGISCIQCIRARGTQSLKPLQNYPTDIPNGFIPFSGTWNPVIGTRLNNVPKFEDLAPASTDTNRKLALLFQIPNRERACLSGITPSETSYSAEHTPSMSSVPQTSAKFSVTDLKAKMVKREKSEGTPAPKPVHVPVTRSSKRKKSSDTVINLESFEGLSASETKDKVFLGVDHLFQLLNDELLDAKEKYLELKKTAAQKEKAWKKETAETAEKVEEEKRLMVEEAQNSATTSVVEAMYEMAKEAAAVGFSLPTWNLKGWAQMLGKTEDEEPVRGKVVVDAGQKVGVSGSRGGDGVPMGDEGVLTA